MFMVLFSASIVSFSFLVRLYIRTRTHSIHRYKHTNTHVHMHAQTHVSSRIRLQLAHHYTNLYILELEASTILLRISEDKYG